MAIVQTDLDTARRNITTLLQNSSCSQRKHKLHDCTDSTDFVSTLHYLTCKMKNLRLSETDPLVRSVLNSIYCPCPEKPTKEPNMSTTRRRATMRKRRNEQKRSRMEQKRCKANAILSAMAECYMMLNTKLMDTWFCILKQKTGTSCQFFRTIRFLIGLHKRKLPLHLSYPVQNQYISFAAVLGVVWLLTLSKLYRHKLLSQLEKEVPRPSTKQESLKKVHAAQHTEAQKRSYFLRFKAASVHQKELVLTNWTVKNMLSHVLGFRDDCSSITRTY